MRPKKHEKLAWKEKVNASMASLVAVRSDAELCGCMIEAYRPFAKVVNNCIKHRLQIRSAIVRRLLEKFLMLCYSIKKDLPESDHKQKHPLSYEKLASIFLSQFMNVSALSRDMNKQTKCSTVAMHLFLILGSSVLHLVEALLNVNTDLLFCPAVNYFSLYKRIMEKCATMEMNVAVYLRCIVMSIHWFKVLPNNLKHDVIVCLNKIETKSISLNEMKAILKDDVPNSTEMNRMSVKLLKKLSHQGRIELLKSFNSDAKASLDSANIREVRSFEKPKKAPSLPSSGMFFMDNKADASMLRLLSKEKVEEDGEPGEQQDLEGKEEEKIQRETDALIADIDLTIPGIKNVSKRKKGHSNADVTAGENLKKKCYSVESDEFSRDESQPHTEEDGQEEEKSDSNENDSAVSENMLTSEESLGKNQACEGVTKASVLDKINTLEKQRQPKNCEPRTKRDSKAHESTLIEDIDETKSGSKSAPKRKRKLDHSNSEFKTDGKQKKKFDTMELHYSSNYESQEGLTKVGCQEVEESDSSENDIVVSESSMTNDERFGKIQADEKVTEASIFEKKHDAIKFDKNTSDENQQDLKNEVGQDMEESDLNKNDITVSEKSLESEESLGKNQACERVTKASIFSKINALKKQSQPNSSARRKTGDNGPHESTLIEDNDKTISGSKDASKRKLGQSNSDLKMDEKHKKKLDTIELHDISSDKSQLTEAEESDSNDNDIVVSESSLTSEEIIQADEKVAEASVFDKKHDIVEPDENSSDENQEDLKNKVGQDAEESDSNDNDIVVSESSLTSDEIIQADEKVAEASVFDKKHDIVEPDENSSDENQEDLKNKVGQDAEESESNENDIIILESSLENKEKLEKNQTGEEVTKSNALNEGDYKIDESLAHERESLLNSFQDVTPNSSEKISVKVSNTDGANTPKKRQILAMDNAVDVKLKAKNEAEGTNIGSSSGDSLDKQDVAQIIKMPNQKDSPVMQIQQESAKVDDDRADSKVSPRIIAVDKGGTSDSDPDEEIVRKRRANSASYRALSDSEEDNDSDNEAVERKSLLDNSDAASQLVHPKTPLNDNSSDADSEMSSMISEASKDFSRRKSESSASPGSSDVDGSIGGFFIEEANEDNRREEDMSGSAESDVDDFLNDETSESDDAESSSPISSPKRKSDARGWGSKSESPVRNTKSSPSSGKLPKMPVLSISSVRSDGYNPSIAIQSPSLNPCVPLIDVNSMLKSVNGCLESTTAAAEKAVQDESQIDNEEKNGEDGIFERNCSGRKSPKTPTSLRRSHRRKLFRTSGSNDDDNAASSPSRRVQPIAITPTTGFTRSRRNNNEAKTEPRKIGKTIKSNDSETPVTKKSKLSTKRVAASAVVTRARRKTGKASESGNNEDSSTSPAVHKAKPVHVSKTSPRVLRSGYQLRPRSPKMLDIC